MTHENSSMPVVDWSSVRRVCPTIMETMRRVFVDRDAPQRDAIQEAAKWILNGGLVALPTDTLYGLAADPFSADAIARVFAVKGRSAERALPLIASETSQVTEHLSCLSDTAEWLVHRFWPGPLTLLVPAPAALARDVTGGTGKVGVRVPADARRARFAPKPEDRSPPRAPTSAASRRRRIPTRSSVRSAIASIS